MIANPNYAKTTQVAKCIKQGICTFYSTSKKHQSQQYYNCEDCFSEPFYGCCVVCVEKCHKGHKISEIKESSSFFCDCPVTEGVKCCAYSEKENIFNKIVFHCACKNGNISTETLKILSKDFDFMNTDQKKNTALHYICSSNLSIENLEIFADHFGTGFLKNTKNENAFQIAFKNEKISIEICNYFLQKNLDPSKALKYSCLNGNETLFDYFASKNLNFNEKCINYCLKGKQNLNILQKLIHSNHFQKQKFFLGISLESENPKLEIVNYLIEFKCDISHKNLLHRACSNENIDTNIIQLLIDKSKRKKKKKNFKFLI